MRICAFQRAIDKVQGVAQKANLSFKNRFPYISVIDEASDFKFGMQPGFAKTHHQIPLFLLGGILLWALATSSRIPILKSL